MHRNTYRTEIVSVINRYLSKATLIVMLLSIAVVASAQEAASETPSKATCTLADHITALNTDEQVADCELWPYGPVIGLEEDIVLTEPLPAITSRIIIAGRGHSISGNNRFRIFEVDGGDLTITGMHIYRGFADYGGAISVRDGKLTVKESMIYGCRASQGGGAILNVGGEVTIIDSHMIWNIARMRGGAILNTGNGSLAVEDSSFESNHALWGGAVKNGEATGFIKTTRFYHNTAIKSGGAIGHTHGTLQISDSIFDANTAGIGGAIYAAGRETQLDVSGSNFQGNFARGHGGAIDIRIEHLYITSSELIGNVANGRGGGIISWYAPVFIIDSKIAENVASKGPGVYVECCDVTIVESLILDNVASNGGEPVYSEKGELRIFRSDNRQDELGD